MVVVVVRRLSDEEEEKGRERESTTRASTQFNLWTSLNFTSSALRLPLSLDSLPQIWQVYGFAKLLNVVRAFNCLHHFIEVYPVELFRWREREKGPIRANLTVKAEGSRTLKFGNVQGGRGEKKSKKKKRCRQRLCRSFQNGMNGKKICNVFKKEILQVFSRMRSLGLPVCLSETTRRSQGWANVQSEANSYFRYLCI